MKRRDFIKSTAAVAGASVAGRLGFAQNPTEPGPQPNILFILVDELRWPSVFPFGVEDSETYFKRFMPNLYKYIWKKASSSRTITPRQTPAHPLVERFSPASTLIRVG